VDIGSEICRFGGIAHLGITTRRDGEEASTHAIWQVCTNLPTSGIGVGL